MNLGYLWKALYNERLIGAIDTLRWNVSDRVGRWKRMGQVQDNMNTGSGDVQNDNAPVSNGDHGTLLNNGRPVATATPAGCMTGRSQQQRPRPQGDESNYLDRHIRY